MRPMGTGGCHLPRSCWPRSPGLCRPPCSQRALASLKGRGNQPAGPTALLKSPVCQVGRRCGDAGGLSKARPLWSAASRVPAGSVCWTGLAELGEQSSACSPGGSPSREQRPPPAARLRHLEKPVASPWTPGRREVSLATWAKVSWLTVSGTDVRLKYVPSWALVGKAFKAFP